ncbi:uncharacterized protein [Leptinotarsa decemlineata]|uniref:uncharacterized protein n=1 Tax=Leptinotarsa decemlineata TaxID=7539 RepID=UPI003D304232
MNMKNNSMREYQLLFATCVSDIGLSQEKNAVKKVIRSCVRCFRTSPKTHWQQMENLPERRLQKTTLFSTTEVHYGGPMNIKESHRRGKVQKSKCYIAVFICIVTKAIHIELVSNLSTEAFLAAFRHFIVRRGACRHLYSDNATNFQGANNELRELYQFLLNQANIEVIANALSNQQRTWHFIPPRNPHFGGLWESSIKSVKNHIKKVIGGTLLRFEEYATILSQIELCINSRPITPISNDPSDLNPLTPNHFLFGDSFTGIEEADFFNTKTNTLSRWQHLQKMKQDIWKRWQKEFLSTLQQRTKWKTNSANIMVSDQVLVIDNSINSKWPLGRIIEVHPGNDNLIRVVTVKMASGTSKRAITRIAKLPIDS